MSLSLYMFLNHMHLPAYIIVKSFCSCKLKKLLTFEQISPKKFNFLSVLKMAPLPCLLSAIWEPFREAAEFSISGTDKANHSGFWSNTAFKCVFGIAMDAHTLNFVNIKNINFYLNYRLLTLSSISSYNSGTF